MESVREWILAHSATEAVLALAGTAGGIAFALLLLAAVLRKVLIAKLRRAKSVDTAHMIEEARSSESSGRDEAERVDPPKIEAAPSLPPITGRVEEVQKYVADGDTHFVFLLEDDARIFYFDHKNWLLTFLFVREGHEVVIKDYKDREDEGGDVVDVYSVKVTRSRRLKMPATKNVES